MLSTIYTQWAVCITSVSPDTCRKFPQVSVPGNAKVPISNSIPCVRLYHLRVDSGTQLQLHPIQLAVLGLRLALSALYAYLSAHCLSPSLHRLITHSTSLRARSIRVHGHRTPYPGHPLYTRRSPANCRARGLRDSEAH